MAPGDVAARPGPAAVRVVVRALLRAGDRIVLVREAYQDMTLWLAPGGAVEPGELLTTALIREVREEVGLTVHTVGPIAFCINTRRDDATTTLVVFFEITDWSGTPEPVDPDILDAALVSTHDAVGLVSSEPQAPRRIVQPLAEYLLGRCPPGTTWTWDGDNTDATWGAAHSRDRSSR
ncbi:hypothetical protein GCM10009682_24050 [Luedemannella flava]|uniref:Nudix hydrolase domain-containing protein n=1 Tax=Luedemannella flava TaxID=349316 RepID=A0ABP4Y5Q6_9ACTN